MYGLVKVDQRKDVKDFKAQFKGEFGVGVRVFRGQHIVSAGRLQSLTAEGSRGGKISFGGQTKVKNVEKQFLDTMGIKVEILDKGGDLADNNATLASLKN